MKKILLLALTLCVSFAAWAGDRSDEEMRAIALSQMVSPSVKGQFPTTFHVDRLQQYNQMSVYGNTDGYVFVSRDDRITPVLGYSDGVFDANNLPEGLRWWIQKMDQCLADWRNAPDDVVAARQEAVLRLVNGYTAVDNFVKSKWDQQDPYNYYTPTVNGVKAATGCVATAMAQILYYFQYPAQGRGEGYYFKGTSSMPNRVDIDGVYEYDKMKNVYTSSTVEQKKVIGTLMRDCGYAAQMSYNVDSYGSSGAHIFNAAAGMATNFSYDELAIRYYTRDYFTEAEWLKLVYDELTLRRPILYGGVDKSSGGGHAFVLSGFDADGLVFVNWGWSGSGNDYYNIALLNSPNGSFSTEQDMAFRLKPHENADPEDYYESMWTFWRSDDQTPQWTAKLTGSALRLTYDNYCNMHFLPFSGEVCILFQDATTGVIAKSEQIKTGDYETLSGGSGNSRSYSFSSLSSLAAGKTYLVYIASKHKDESQYSPARCGGEIGAIYYELTKKSDSSFDLSDAKNFAGSAPEPVVTYKLTYMVNDKVYKTYDLVEGATITVEPAPEVEEDYEFSGWSSVPSTMPAHDVVVTGYIYRVKAYAKLSSTGYATFYNSESSFAVPSGVTASVVKGVSAGKLQLQTLSVIPAGTAVLLKGATNAALTLNRVASATPYTGANLLYGSDEATTTTAPGSNLYYKLTFGQPGTYQADVFGWYWGAAGGAAFSIEGGKAWLAVPASAAKDRRFFRVDEDAMGIDMLDVQVDDADAVYYDLQGRRVTTPAHGIFIRNGRKVYVK